MSPIHSFSSPFVKSALVAFATTLLMGRSPDLQATGEREATVASARAQAASTEAPASADLKAGESRVDALEITGDLVNDPDHPSRLAVELVVKNPTDQEITSRCLVVLERSSGNPMARVSPPPSTVWQHTEELEVVAHGSIRRLIPLPQAQSAAVNKARKAAEAAEAKGVMLSSYVSYGVTATPQPMAQPAARKPRAGGDPARAAQASSAGALALRR